MRQFECDVCGANRVGFDRKEIPMKSRRKFLTSIRLYPGDAAFLKALAAKTDRTVSYYIQEAVSKFVASAKRSTK